LRHRPPGGLPEGPALDALPRRSQPRRVGLTTSTNAARVLAHEGLAESYNIAQFLGKIEVIEYSRDRTIKGVGRDYPMPAVVRLLRRFRRDRQAIKFSRLNIYTRDRFTCQYCGGQLLAEPPQQPQRNPSSAQ
jgi:hypothetical protein